MALGRKIERKLHQYFLEKHVDPMIIIKCYLGAKEKPGFKELLEP